MRDERERLLDVHEAIERIEKYAVWQVVQRDLPDLKGKIEQVLRTAGGSENRFR